MSRIRIFGVIAAVLAIGVATAGVAEGAKVKNGNFEKGSFKNWKTKTTPSDLPAPPRGVILTTRWRLYTKQDRDIGVLMRPPYARGGGNPIRLPKPKGKYSPVIDMSNPGHNVLYRTLKVPSSAKTLKLKAYWHNDARNWSFAGSFLQPEEGDQYFSIDLLEPNADPESAKNSDRLEHLFSPDPDPAKAAGRRSTDYVSGWKSFKASVKKYQGQKVTLRLAETDTQSFNYVGIDNVKFGK